MVVTRKYVRFYWNLFCLHMIVPLKIRMIFVRKTETLSKVAYLYTPKNQMYNWLLETDVNQKVST